ncbi:MAG: DNA translocase FtsK [Flavobacteriaceae bacterium]|nr:DNA translocase FtsK [Flavobacteriaceae bacterium]
MTKTKKSSENQNSISIIQKINLFFESRKTQSIIGTLLFLVSIFLMASFISFFTNRNWEKDQSQLIYLTDKSIEVDNFLGKIGASLSHFFITDGFGIASFIIPVLLFLTGLYLIVGVSLRKRFWSWSWAILGMIWISVFLATIDLFHSVVSGTIGFELNEYAQIYLGKMGLILSLLFGFLFYITIRMNFLPEKFIALFNKKTTEDISTEIDEATEKIIPIVEKPIIKDFSITNQEAPIEIELDNFTSDEIPIDIAPIANEIQAEENLAETLVQKYGEFDPRLELSNYKFPTLNLLKDYDDSIAVNQEELESNKNRIVDTLNNYKIGIKHIKATVGPTVTLYEIVPDDGIRIAKIKNLEDDIALSLAALGIRIIAPMPGKGTIGIEVPNKNPTIVSMKSVISSLRFQNAHMELPIALGKTISNETFVVDLTKMPHLLMAGATGQGKSVGLNAVLASLLYKKHPAEVKFILVDPKKVELTLFNKIERHYLAKLPDSEEAIINDTSKVINTLNSLCIEMDNRYDLLKLGMVRNIKEYNTKFVQRKLNPELGHRYLPYIVLVIDEFADLIMTAGKEIEMPISRLTQLARAIGIHLIVATQRPSVNVITGIIKANFPSRIAFRVTSKIDSRTILDGSGADQLVGKGDMLYSGGSDLIRIQCAFIDTPEIEKITEYVGSQRAYANAYILPEYSGEDSGTSIDIDLGDRDELFNEAARLIVIAQQGSASLLQRKLKLGYNRAGRLIDQLEAAGIVGPFEGSKARQVLIHNEITLNQLLDNQKNNI